MIEIPKSGALAMSRPRGGLFHFRAVVCVVFSFGFAIVFLDLGVDSVPFWVPIWLPSRLKGAPTLAQVAFWFASSCSVDVSVDSKRFSSDLESHHTPNVNRKRATKR